MSRAVRFDEYGGVDVLRVDDVEDPAPGAAEVVVSVRAAGINPGEAKIREGLLHDLYPATFPSGQGSDLAGVIASVGEGVTRWSVGDEVLGWTDARASQAELVVVPATQLIAKPADLSWAQAGALHVAGATAWACVRAVAPEQDETVVISGAAGGVGTIAVQLAVRTEATVIALASEPNHEWLRSLGAVPVSYGDGVEQRILAAAPNGVDAFIDLVGPPYVDLALGLGVKNTRINTVADFAAIAEKQVRGDGNAVGARPEVFTELAALIVAGELELPIAASYSLDDVREAYTELGKGHTRGKIVLIP